MNDQHDIEVAAIEMFYQSTLIHLGETLLNNIVCGVPDAREKFDKGLALARQARGIALELIQKYPVTS